VIGAADKTAPTNPCEPPLKSLSVVVCGAHLAEYIKPTVHPPKMYLTPAKGDSEKGGDDKKPPVPNPDYETWIAKDKTVLNYLMSSLSKVIFS
jgi:hypothetical protein